MWLLQKEGWKVTKIHQQGMLREKNNFSIMMRSNFSLLMLIYYDHYERLTYCTELQEPGGQLGGEGWGKNILKFWYKAGPCFINMKLNRKDEKREFNIFFSILFQKLVKNIPICMKWGITPKKGESD